MTGIVSRRFEVTVVAVKWPKDGGQAQREALELAVARPRETKSQLPEDEYYRALEKLMLQIARLTVGGAAR